MIRKEDIDEIENSMNDSNKKNLENYNILKSKKDNKNKKTKLNKGLKIFLITMIVLILIIIFFKLYIFISIPFSNLMNRYNANLIETIESSNHIKVKVISQNFDEYGNGECYLKLKKFSEIKFKAIKKWGEVINDYESQLHKYLFENWNNSKKDKFTIIEKITEDGFLEYETYIEISNIEEYEEATELIINFLEYTDKWNKDNKKVIDISWQKDGQFIYPISKIYLIKDNTVISPYYACYQTADEIRKSAKELYVNLSN